MIKIVSPSKNRLDYTIDKVFPLVDIICEPQDAEKYRERVGENALIVMPENDKGFGYVMDFLVRHYHLAGQKYILFADDDIYGLKQRNGKPVDLNRFLFEAEEIMRKENYAQLMVSFAGHNWYVKDQKFKEKVGAWGMVFLDVEKITEIGGYDTRLKIFNDWDLSAKLIVRGFKTACWYDYMFLHKMKSKDGGAMGYYKDSDFMKVQCGYMLKRYGDKVKVIFHKKHNQFEVRFKWNKL
jgi:hypothetical protein